MEVLKMPLLLGERTAGFLNGTSMIIAPGNTTLLN